ncbi:hypothetical protein Q5752_001558 [Cryptotrichosporon argae]
MPELQSPGAESDSTTETVVAPAGFVQKDAPAWTYVPRYNAAATPEAPDGTTQDDWAAKHKNESVVQQHVLYFDRDGDGVIWPTDTYRGLADLGYHFVWCFLATAIIHSGFAYWTATSWIPDPRFPLYVKYMHRAKHGSDTGTYDADGRFLPHKFEEIFTKYDEGDKGGITFREGMRMLQHNRNPLDIFGVCASFVEFCLTWGLAYPDDGVIPKEFMRRVYDGSVFYEVAAERAARQGKPFKQD